MKTNILFITNNKNKINEYIDILPQNINLYSLSDFDISPEYDENGTTFEQNAKIKLQSIDANLLKDINYIISEDSGICVDVLDGAPGVYSKRFSGGDDNDNNELLLKKLQGEKNRKARFVANIGIKNVKTGEISNVQGIMNGSIANEISQSGEGFAYDFVFIPTNATETISNLGQEYKNQISHRNKAIMELIKFLQS